MRPKLPGRRGFALLMAASTAYVWAYAQRYPAHVRLLLRLLLSTGFGALIGLLLYAPLWLFSPLFPLTPYIKTIYVVGPTALIGFLRGDSWLRYAVITICEPLDNLWQWAFDFVLTLSEKLGCFFCPALVATLNRYWPLKSPPSHYQNRSQSGV